MYNFFFEPLSPKIFGYYRISIGFIALLLCILLYPDLYLLFGQNGLVIWDISDNLANPLQPTIGRLYKFIGEKNVDASLFLNVLFGSYIFVLISFTIGFYTRVMSILAWLLHLTFINTCRFGSYGVESLLNVALFYSIFFPCGAAKSLDNYGKSVPPNSYSRLCLRVLQIQMCIIYASSGIEKCFGEEWWNGNAVWFSLTEEQFSQFDFTWISKFPIVVKVLGWWTIISETGYSIFMWIKKTRQLWLINILMLHLGIGIFMGLYSFALIMIILNILAFSKLSFSVSKKSR